MQTIRAIQHPTQSRIIFFQWAFGIVMWEIFTKGSTPYYWLKNDEVHNNVVRRNVRLEKPPRMEGWGDDL